MRSSQLSAPIDLEASNRIRDQALSRATILNASQRENIQRKCDDLYGERLEWESVPFRLMLEPNRRCNVQCLHCDIERAGTRHLALPVIARLMDEIGWGTMEILPFVGGEPTLAPIAELAALARRTNNYLNFTTNGLLFTHEYYSEIADVVSRVHFSLHSHLPEVHARIMPGVDFDRLVRNVEAAVEIAEDSGAQILAGMVLMDSNLDGLADYVRFVAELGVRRVILQKLYPQSHAFPAEGLAVHRTPEEIRRQVSAAMDAAAELGVFVETNVDEAFGDARNQNPFSSPFDILQDYSHVVELYRPGFCISTAIMLLIEWDGTVLPCCRDRIPLGNLNNTSFQGIWNGEPMKRLRASFFERELRPFCKRCMGFYNGHS